jgi:negative regulator of flagellin synthesis FlgM
MTIQSKTRGQRMKITGATAPAVTLMPQGPAVAAADATPAPAAARAAPLQAETLQPAKAAMGAMPEIDHARVAELRDLLAKGELPFDAARLAGLIQRFHGGQP